MSNPSGHSLTPPGANVDVNEGDLIDLREAFRRLGRGLSQILGLGLLGLAIAATIYLAASRFGLVSTSARVVFSFPGVIDGRYPDGSKFKPEDLCAPDVIATALQSQGLDTSSDYQSKIRAALTIEGIIPGDIIKAHDRMRAAGQTPTPFLPDEYAVTLTLPRGFSLNNGQRGRLLGAIVSAFRNKFEATYVKVPVALGTGLDSLKTADLSEYEQIILPDIDNIISYLNQQLDQAKDFRSQTTSLTFSDLLDRVRVFSQIRVNEILGLIRQNGLSNDRELALTKIQFALQAIQDQEDAAIQDEKVIQSLLNEARDRVQSYVLGIKSQTTRPEGPILDQGLVDSLLANDSYNFLIRRDLDAGLKVKHLEADKIRLLERQKYLLANDTRTPGSYAIVLAQVRKSQAGLESSYRELINDIRSTQVDFANQEYADAVAMTQSAHTEGKLQPLMTSSLVGLFLGLAMGMGLSLLGVYAGEKRR